LASAKQTEIAVIAESAVIAVIAEIAVIAKRQTVSDPPPLFHLLIGYFSFWLTFQISGL
jgi:hypothetical protein